jgi:thiamine pyrophosphokinase
MKGLAFIGGESPDAKRCGELAAGGGIIAAADSGLICAENAGLAPDWICGDMDSLDDLARLEKYPPERVLRFPPDKDWTDTELVIDLLARQGCDDITLVGGGGGRLDHTLALAALFERENCPSRWFTAHESIFPVTKFFSLTVPLNTLISVFPIGTPPWKTESFGLKWKLDAVEWERRGAGISNVAEEESITINPLEGRFLVVVNGLPLESTLAGCNTAQ